VVILLVPGLVMSTGFRCKQFYVDHRDCAMKVSTDALLLGAWTQLPATGAILDIGTGSGILTLMLAQRCQQQAAVILDAIELDSHAADVAAENFRQSPWSAKIRLIKGDILTYPASADHPSDRRYQLIISNPPFFVDSLKASDPKRNQARHTDTLSFTDLLTAAARLLAPDGVFSLVLPTAGALQLIMLAQQSGWLLQRQCWVQSKAGKPPLRCLFSLSRLPQMASAVEVTVREQLLIHAADGSYSAEYRALLRDFYLKF
jgi:tRNA1Val (adenine37-N6)-methyltransferase